jgi:hypothetical protein
LLLAVDALCGDVHLCKISKIPLLAGMDTELLTAALYDSVVRGHTVLVGEATPGGFIWLTRAGAIEADRLLSRQIADELEEAVRLQDSQPESASP